MGKLSASSGISETAPTGSRVGNPLRSGGERRKRTYRAILGASATPCRRGRVRGSSDNLRCHANITPCLAWSGRKDRHLWLQINAGRTEIYPAEVSMSPRCARRYYRSIGYKGVSDLEETKKGRWSFRVVDAFSLKSGGFASLL